MDHDSPVPPSLVSPPPVEREPRPAGVAILAVLHALGSIALLGILGAVYARWPDSAEGMQAAGIAPTLFVIGILFLAALAVASAVGMWKGARWGWWAAALYYFYSLFRNGWALYLAIAYFEEFDAGTRGADYYSTKHGGRIVVHGVILFYLMREKVLAYFGLSRLNRLKAAGILVGVCVGITAVSSLAAMFMTE